MKTELYNIRANIRPFRDIIWFLFLFIMLDFLWKLAVNVDENDTLYVFGKNFTHYADPICLWTANVSHWIVQTLFGYGDFKIEGTVLYFDHPVTIKDTIMLDTSLKLKIVWECTGIQQMILFMLIMIFYWGPVKKKLWFIPLSLFILNLINILRIVASAMLIKDGVPDWFISFNEWNKGILWQDNIKTAYRFYIDWFEMFHKEIFKWLYYNGVMFLLWLLWQEKFNLPYQRKKLLEKQNNRDNS